jgi:pantoate--beta-alanine ligase
MIIFKTIAPLQRYLNKLQNKNVAVGFVPTMGALHEGHLSLVNESRKTCDITVCSIFVNPIQFNDKKDFEKYPVTIENDIFLLETNHADILFLPSIKEIYPDGINKLQHFDIGYLENIQEGKYRPGHFQGVCNVVFRLLKIVNPNTLFLGRKDYQQYLILRNMVHHIFPFININAVDIARESNGLAMSSRNMRLSDDARVKASALHEALQFIQQYFGAQPIDALIRQAKNIILTNGFKKIDYLQICNTATLLPATDNTSDEKLIALAAAFIEDVRLIDNVII